MSTSNNILPGCSIKFNNGSRLNSRCMVYQHTDFEDLLSNFISSNYGYPKYRAYNNENRRIEQSHVPVSHVPSRVLNGP